VFSRLVLPIAVTLIVAAGVHQLWLQLHRQEEEQVARMAAVESYATRSHIARSLETMNDALHYVRSFWDAYGAMPRDQWQSDAHIELDHFKGIDLLLYQQSAYDARFLKSQDHPGYDYRPTEAEWARHEALLARLAEQTESTMLGPFEYPDGRLYFEVFVPGESQAGVHGLVALVDPEELIGRLLVDEAPTWAIEVFQGQRRLFARGTPATNYPESWEREGLIRTPQGPLWRIVHRPTAEAVAAMRSATPELVLTLGSVIAALMGFLTFESARARRRAGRAEAAERELASLNRELEARVARRTRALEERTGDLQTITDSMAHDLRNPLGAISMNVQVLRAQIERNQDPSQQLRAIERIEPSIVVISNFLDELMGLSALAHQTFEREPLDMRALFVEVFETLEDAEPPPSVSLEVDEDLPGVEADALLVRVLVTNLLTNALKYTRQESERRVTVSHRRSDGVTEYAVSDNGVGFDMDEADRLFEAFERLSAGERFQGTGLGLTIVARVIRRHGGRIRAEGAAGEGATFRFTLAPSPGDDAAPPA